jgi:rhamnosyltransferase
MGATRPVRMNNSCIRRAVIFAQYDIDDIVDAYVMYYLRTLKNVCNHLVFVTTSALPEDEVSKVKDICDNVVLRENVGYDFMSYTVGLQYLKNGEYDEVVLCNDSVYGPLFPLGETFTKMQTQDCDFWGITENYHPTYHIQSYFLVFRKNVLESQCFKKFWEGVSIKEKKSDIIEEYEIELSRVLINNGFRARAYITYRPSSLEFLMMRRLSIKKVFNLKSWVKLVKDVSSSAKEQKLNPTHYFWRQLIKEKKMPFIKIELVRDNPMKINVKDYEDVIRRYTDYNIKLLRRHLERVRFKRHPGEPHGIREYHNSQLQR